MATEIDNAALASEVFDSETFSFWDPEDKVVRETTIRIDTSLNGRMLVVRHACQDHCADSGYPAWAQRSDLDDSKPWLVFRLQGRMAMFVGHFPSKEAAEMWLIHHYGG